MNVSQGIAELPRDIRITTDFSINERILGISTEGPEKYVRLSWETVIIFGVALRLAYLARMDRESQTRGRGKDGALRVTPVRARRRE